MNHQSGGGYSGWEIDTSLNSMWVIRIAAGTGVQLT
jgi:hypothetical protein